MRARAKVVGTFAALAAGLFVAVPGEPVGAVSNVCGARSSVKIGTVGWQLRQASGLTTVSGFGGVLFTHNDRGIKDSPYIAKNEDTTFAAVWAISTTDAHLLSRVRLTSQNRPIEYFDTEAISTDRSHRLVNNMRMPDQVVLADTGTNVDARTTVALYRFTPPAIDAQFDHDQEAEVIPIDYFNKATGGTPVKLNVEAFMVDASGNGWFIPRTSSKPYVYEATATALNTASGTSNPARAVRMKQLTINGPVTDASISPDGTMLLVKTMEDIYAYTLTPGRSISDVLGDPQNPPCHLAFAANKNQAGYGEAITARDDGGFYTVPEGAKGARAESGVAPVWSFTP